MVENKQIMAKSILKYMERDNVKATDICKALGFKQNTFSDWVHARTYPRIDAIEKLANYFHISKADLVEEVPLTDTVIIKDDLRVLLEVAQGCSSEDIRAVTDILSRLKSAERIEPYSRALSNLKKKE